MNNSNIKQFRIQSIEILQNILSADFFNKIINQHNLAIFHHNTLEICNLTWNLG